LNNSRIQPYDHRPRGDNEIESEHGKMAFFPFNRRRSEKSAYPVEKQTRVRGRLLFIQLSVINFAARTKLSGKSEPEKICTGERSRRRLFVAN
jgi:hypothetical protein